MSGPGRMGRFGPVAFLAGVGCFGLGFAALTLSPFLAEGSAGRMAVAPPSVAGASPDGAVHLEALRQGRDAYVAEACWHCHSQYVRPLPEELVRYGPVSTAQEYSHALQLPQLFGTRRVGPDLIREAGRRSDDWHYAHLWKPKATVPESVMPSYRWWFREIQVVAEPAEEQGKWRLRPGPWQESIAAAAYPRFAVTPGPDGRAFAGAARGTPVPVFPGAADSGGEPRPFTLVVPTARGRAAVAYLQSLGRHAVARRDVSAERAAAAPAPRSIGPGDAAQGAVSYARHCSGCHGVAGDGLGPAAAFLEPRPRDLRGGLHKFKSTAEGLPPLDSDLFATITVGIPGTSMPGWGELSERERWDLVAFLGSLREPSRRPDPANPPVPLAIPAETTDDAASRTRGRAAYEALCMACHGAEGRGSEGAPTPVLDDADGFPTLARDLTDPASYRAGRSGPDLYRRVAVGIPGTPMPAFLGGTGEHDIWDLVHYVRSLSEAPAR